MTVAQAESCRVHQNCSNDGKQSFIFSCCIHDVLHTARDFNGVKRGQKGV